MKPKIDHVVFRPLSDVLSYSEAISPKRLLKYIGSLASPDFFSDLILIAFAFIYVIAILLRMYCVCIRVCVGVNVLSKYYIK